MHFQNTLFHMFTSNYYNPSVAQLAIVISFQFPTNMSWLQGVCLPLRRPPPIYRGHLVVVAVAVGAVVAVVVFLVLVVVEAQCFVLFFLFPKLSPSHCIVVSHSFITIFSIPYQQVSQHVRCFFLLKIPKIDVCNL